MIGDFFSIKTPQNPSFPFFSIIHLIPLFIIFSIFILVYIKKDVLKKTYNRRLFMTILGIIMLIQQIFFYSWYMCSRIGLKEALPLYMCRITAIIVIYTLFTDTKKFHFIIYFWGLLGATIALLMPDTSGHLFPHIMFVQFFITHGGILVALLFFMVVDGYRPEWSDFLKITAFTVVYALIINIINPLVCGNYAYFSAPPKSAAFFSALPKGLIYKLGLLGILILLSFILYIPFLIIGKPKKRNLSQINYIEIPFE